MELGKRAAALNNTIETAIKQIHLPDLEAELQKLLIISQTADFWHDNKAAKETMRRINQLEARIRPWRELEKLANDLSDLIALKDTSLETDLDQQISAAEQELGDLKKELRFGGPYDDHDAIVSIYAGAGGTDAQDWAQMLLRMYTRWAESGSRGRTHHGGDSSSARSPDSSRYGLLHSSASSGAASARETQKYTIKVLEESSGEEAGLKSITFEIGGPFAYGKLKGEHGVHRLVRLSPFNADHLRQTSFAKVDVLPKVDTPQDLEIDDKDLKIDVFRSGGRGGQSVNTTDSAVRVTHLPTSIVVTIQNERSQLQNKETAMTILRSKLAQLQLEQHAQKIADLKGPNEQAAWGNQIRSYVLHPYKQVKDVRTRYETSDVEAVLSGDIEAFIGAYLDYLSGDSFDKP